jgi:hypothetical protein
MDEDLAAPQPTDLSLVKPAWIVIRSSPAR